jgi:hypothetical protein
MRESGWNRFARNPSSGAYGIPQALPPTKLPPAGQAGGGSHASPQIDWGLNYIKTTPGYGSPAAAWAHEQAHGWYPSGGTVGGGVWDWDGGRPYGGTVGGDGASLPAMAAGGLLGLSEFASGGLADWSALNTAVHSEAAAMGVVQAAHLPAKGPTMAQRHAYTAWQEALWKQQLKTIGLGRTPPGAYQALLANAANPARQTAGQWQAFTGDVGYLLREEEGTGIPGGINPPGTPANSGSIAYRYLRPQWQRLLDALRTVNTRAKAAQVQWGSQFSTTPLGPGGTGQTGHDSPEWDAARDALNTAVRTEMQWMRTMQSAHLPRKGPTQSQRYDYTSWQEALWRQQLKAVGLGRRPPGAYQAISDRLNAPGTITQGMWNTFLSDMHYLEREEEGPGAGGINPPGSRRNSGYPAWHWLHNDWQTLLNTIRNAQAKAKAAETVWSRLYGPHHIPYTPGPGGPPKAAPVGGGLVNVMPEATIGGPGHPVFDIAPGGADMGFAAGGGLGQVASLFSGGFDPGGVMLPVVARYGVPTAVLHQLTGASGGSSAPRDYPRRVSEAAAASYQGPAVNFENVTINNPLPQKPSDSIAHSTARLAFLAGRMN